jgi:hypothetical protein
MRSVVLLGGRNSEAVYAYNASSPWTRRMTSTVPNISTLRLSPQSGLYMHRWEIDLRTCSSGLVCIAAGRGTTRQGLYSKFSFSDRLFCAWRGHLNQRMGFLSPSRPLSAAIRESQLIITVVPRKETFQSTKATVSTLAPTSPVGSSDSLHIVLRYCDSDSKRYCNLATGN